MESRSADASADTNVLGYSQPPSRRGRRIILSIVAILVLAGSVATRRYHTELWRRSQIAYWERQCLRYSAAESVIAYDRIPTAPNRLAFANLPSAGAPFPPARGISPSCWTNFDSLAGPFFVPPGPNVNRTPDAVIFLHERTSPAGKRFLVCVGAYSAFSNVRAVAMDVLASVAIDCSSWTAPPATVHYPSFGKPLHVGGDPRTVAKRVFAGQIDPKDSSRFTIRYTLDGKADVIDGAVDDNGNVVLTSRNPSRDGQLLPLRVD